MRLTNKFGETIIIKDKKRVIQKIRRYQIVIVI